MKMGRFIKERPRIRKILVKIMGENPELTYREVANGEKILIVKSGDYYYDHKSFKKQAQLMLENSFSRIDEGRGK